MVPAAVWPCVCRAVPAASFTLQAEALRQRQEMAHGKKVLLEGEVEDARSFMASMKVMIAPLFAGSGLRIKIIEAMSIGRTVVATPVAARTAGRDRREIIIAEEPVSFCDALTEALRTLS